MERSRFFDRKQSFVYDRNIGMSKFWKRYTLLLLLLFLFLQSYLADPALSAQTIGMRREEFSSEPRTTRNDPMIS